MIGARGFDTLTQTQRSGEIEKVPAALMFYVNPGAPSTAGLRRQQKAEEALWSASPRWGRSSSPDQGIMESPDQGSS